MRVNLISQLLLLLLVFNVIVAFNHLEKRDVHRIIIQEESRRPKRQQGHKKHHRHVKRRPKHSFENFSLASYESSNESSKKYGSHSSFSARPRGHFYESNEDFKRQRHKHDSSEYRSFDKNRRKNLTEVLLPPWSDSSYGHVDNFPDFTFNQKFIDLPQDPFRDFKLVAVPENTYEVRENPNEGGNFYLTTQSSIFFDKPFSENVKDKRTPKRGRKRKQKQAFIR
ncbi:hypothetical protein TcasGA2_TC002489 [Tribolium castaneum]|uniref:Uncharacterized protein n=1 Tax=Tribolium castaneum TaxID=7070 RepID=D6WHM4_TRICA|nr:PREDICTED: uncharacterized protein LOC107397680 [Tribolium castaneum]EEZ99724.1 hypothetical protein TcasGA2_TC002489 [Tribolium castaneum]|eukprot:XP_015834091.1 PREDICTED: uncharacterized protein LOC107397680 [Tribolium castaneum]